VAVLSCVNVEGKKKKKGRPRPCWEMGVEFASGKKEFQDADVIPNLRNTLGL